MRGLCLLIRFPDVAETITRQQVDDFCNQPGYTGFGNNGSVRDYFVAASENRLRYTNVVTAYHTAAHNRSHYTDPAIPYGQRAQELIHEALAGLTRHRVRLLDPHRRLGRQRLRPQRLLRREAA